MGERTNVATRDEGPHAVSVNERLTEYFRPRVPAEVRHTAAEVLEELVDIVDRVQVVMAKFAEVQSARDLLSPTIHMDDDPYSLACGIGDIYDVLLVVEATLPFHCGPDAVDRLASPWRSDAEHAVASLRGVAA